MKENCYNSGTSDDTGMKLGPVTKLEKRNKTTSKKIDDNAMSSNCDIRVVFPIYSQLRAIRNPDSGCIVCKFYNFINSDLLSHKNRKQN